ncbi:glutamate 5-kinase [Bifidobacterium bohemicum]|uniref:Glutamate 5-kinase n=1 Tax=Bifidobacterium bohemicum DSM 22767 TaxID=1437606 RepID=A0A086ZES9_9BIFI|nr:glutamate 5-kinase [Bifidobacterium bohemicum]KFI45029.1 glutamate 5-kinase [Bifidobacterium bohemicum DSM 22767]SCB93394.1 glutamate 5-kinase [Bifidobacterium bohemicum]
MAESSNVATTVKPTNHWCESEVRQAVNRAQTVVVKVGSSSLTRPSGHLDSAKVDAIVSSLARIVGGDRRVVLVSSGAIAAGFGPLGLDERPEDVVTQQAAASVGQGLLMQRYETAFTVEGVRVGQILLTVDDTRRASRYRNVRRTLGRLLDLGVVPVVNENDALATNELRFGDNDRLSALVANIVRADALVLLTDVDGLYDVPPTYPNAKRIAFVSDVSNEDALQVTVGDSGSKVGTGGMVTKLEAARVAASSGIPVVLTDAAHLGDALEGKATGTAFAPVSHRDTSRRLWIGFAAAPRGRLTADAGAAKAVLGGRASLLAAGVIAVDGDFSAGDPVWIDDESGNHIAKGLAAYDSEEMPAMLGRSTTALKRLLDPEYAHPLVHRDNLVLL